MERRTALISMEMREISRAFSTAVSAATRLDPRYNVINMVQAIGDGDHKAMTLQVTRRFSKGFNPPRPRRPVAETPLQTTWEEVFEAALRVETPEPQRQHRVTPRTISMEDKVVLILDSLRETTRVEFSRLLLGFAEKMHGVMTFLAGLELTRRRLLYLRQTKPFAELWIYRREDPGEEDLVEDEAEEEAVPAAQSEPVNRAEEGAPEA